MHGLRPRKQSGTEVVIGSIPISTNRLQIIINMSEQLINVEGIDLVHVRMASHAGDSRRRALEFSAFSQEIKSLEALRAAFRAVERLEKLVEQSSRSASTAKAPVLALIRQIEDEHTKFTRDLENEANRLKRAIGEYNAAKEQAE